MRPLVLVPILLALCLLACGGDDDGGSGSGEPDAGSTATSFTVENQDASGQAHRFTIECADLTAGVDRTYTTDGEHAHTVMLTADELATLAEGGTVMISFTDGHEHAFSITVPPDAC